MALVYAVFGNMGTYTLLQSFLFLYSTLLVVDVVVLKFWAIGMIAILNPITLISSVFSDPAIGCMIGLNLLFLAVHKFWQNENHKILHASAFALINLLLGYIIFGFRQNAITLLPVICAFYGYAIWKKKDRLKWVLGLTACFLSLVLISFVSQAVCAKILNSSSAGLVWDTLSTINRMPEDIQQKYNAFYDDIAGEGRTKEALSSTDMNGSVNTFLWSSIDVIIGEESYSQEIQNRYIEFVLNEPEYYFPTKFRMMMRTMGFPEPLNIYPLSMNELGEHAYENGTLSELKATRFINNAQQLMQKFSVYRTPWVWFVLGAVIVLWQRIKTKKFGIMAWLYGSAVFYYGGILLTNQSYEFRYFVPAFQILCMMTLFFLTELLANVKSIAGKKLASFERNT